MDWKEEKAERNTGSGSNWNLFSKDCGNVGSATRLRIKMNLPRSKDTGWDMTTFAKCVALIEGDNGEPSILGEAGLLK